MGLIYDNNGNVVSVTPPSRPAHWLLSNAVNQVFVYFPPNPPSTGLTQYVYNADHQLTQVLRPDSQQVNFSYGSTGKLSGISTPTGNIGYWYNSSTGKLALVTGPDAYAGMLVYTYDGFLPTTETWAGGAVMGSVSWTYDDNFRVATETVANSTEAMTYDADGLLTGAGSLSISRNQSTGLVATTLLDSVGTSITYDNFGEPALLHAAFGSNTVDLGFVQDQLGRITQKTETINSAATTYNYQYDLAGRLTDVCVNGLRQSHYEYDGNSNRTLRRQCAAGIQCQPSTPCLIGTDATGTYDNQDRMTAYGNTTYQYTANGELLSETANNQTTNYQYDVLGNLRSVTLPNGNQINYVIDGRNRRIGKKVNGTLTQGFLYDGQLRIVAELNGSGNLKSRFVYGTRANVPEYMIQGGQNYRIITDHLGSPRFVVNTSTGAIAQQMNYDEFGNVTSDSNPGFQPFGFAGGLYDRDTVLVRFGARDYDPVTGRWTAKDPIGFSGGDTNLFGYVLNDPVNLIDNNGLETGSVTMAGKWGDTSNIPITEEELIGWAIFGATITGLTVAPEIIAALAPFWDEIKENVIRFDLTGSWGPNQSCSGPHFHFDPTTSGRLMVHHLPQESYQWLRHLISIISDWF